MAAPRLLVHGGAGAIPTARRDPGYGAAARRGLLRALASGQRVLARRGSALDAVVAAVVELEDCEVFNAGRGSVLTAEGAVEMDAAVMEGSGRRAGAVAGLRGLANPIRAARAVLERSAHVLLAGPGAESFALAAGLAPVPPGELVTALRREQLERARERVALDFDADEPGTVGAVAVDAQAHLAAATSTGGLTNKLPGRVSDSCLAGAGTWADDATCAVSGTGQGEFFIRCAFAHEVDALMRYRGLELEAACERALAQVRALGGRGGCIALDAAGRMAFPFTTQGMPRGFAAEGGALHVAVHPEEQLPRP